MHNMEYDSVLQTPTSQNLHENWYNSKINFAHSQKNTLQYAYSLRCVYSSLKYIHAYV